MVVCRVVVVSYALEFCGDVLMALASSVKVFHERCTPGDASHGLLSPSISKETLPAAYGRFLVTPER
jgi:hypothetical protein